MVSSHYPWANGKNRAQWTGVHEFSDRSNEARQGAKGKYIICKSELITPTGAGHRRHQVVPTNNNGNDHRAIA